MEVDSLVVSLGLDPQDFRAALNQVLAALQNLDQGLRDFAQGFAEGCEEALNEARQSANGAAQEAGHAAREGKNMGQAFQQAGEKGAREVKHLADTTTKAAQRAKDAGNSMQNLGRQWGSFLQGIVTRFAAPMAGALSVGAMVGSYLSGVSQVARMYGRWTPQMEEWRKKRELLSRVNREDIELYRKGKLALMDFQFAMAGLSTTIMRALSPAIRAGIELLHQAADWVRRNEPNIIRFVTVLAGTITAVLLPAFVKLGAAMLANPLTWIIAGIVALAVAIDDLVVYIRGGESAFGDFWAIFGTGEEIAEKLSAAWERLKETGAALWETLKSGAQTFFGYFEGAIEPLQTQFENFANVVDALLNGTWEDVGNALRDLLISSVKALYAVFEGLAKFIYDKLTGAIQKIPDALAGVGRFFKGLLGIDDETVDAVTNTVVSNPGVLSPLPWKWNSYSSALADPAAPGGPGTPSPVPPSAELTALAVPPSVSTSSRNTEISSQTHINQLNMYTQATDAAGIVRDIQGELDRNPLIPGVNAADGGVF